MSEKKIFRKVSLDRLSSPEELDQRITVTSRTSWLAMAAIALLVISGGIWGFFGSIADKAVGTGIILSSGGITNVIHHAQGQITDLGVSDADYVEKGDVIARIQQVELIEEINQAKEDLAAAEAIDIDNLELNNSMLNSNVYSKISEIYRNYEVAKSSLETQRASYKSQLAQVELDIEQAKLQYEESLDLYNKTKILVEIGGASQKELDDASRQLTVHELSYINKQDNANSVALSQLAKAEADFKSQEQWVKDTIVVAKLDLKNNIEKMQRNLLNNSDIIANVSGRVLEMKVSKGDLIQAGTTICSIAQEDQENNSLEAIVYVPVQDGKKVKPGMEVNISPTTVKKEEHGFMLGNVVSVSEYPSSGQGMLLTLGNQELVQQLSGEGSPIEVRVELVMDSNTVSGYKWSTPNGPPIVVDEGTFCLGEVKVSEQRPISMVLPFIKKILPIY